jgi:eukaryotic-like serine/threonine-protein kinase
VMQLLEKHPADRPQTADEVLGRLDRSPMAQPTTVAAPVHRNQTRRERRLVLAGVAALALLAAAAWLHGHPPGAVPDARVVAVLPFRVTGADSSLRYLREGMLDLLAAKLSGTKDLRTVDPRTLLSAWRREGGSPASDPDHSGALRLARAVGAGRLLEGEVTGTAHRMVLNAKLSDAGGRADARASIDGPPDSLTSLVDRLAAQILVLGAGESRNRLASLTSYSLPALRAYLDGQAAYRRGDFAAARELFTGAIDLDSTFALAALARTLAAMWVGENTIGPVSQLAWRHRDRLSSRDRVLAKFMVCRQQRQCIADAEALVGAAPDSPEAWSILGDWMYHFGPLVGIPDALERSLRAYLHALALDSTYVPTFEHLHELYYWLGDTAGVRRALTLRLRLDSTTPHAAVARWFALRSLHDTALGAISLTDDSLRLGPGILSQVAVDHGIGLADAESLLTLALASASSEAQRSHIQDVQWTFYVIRGQPTRANVGMRYPVTPRDRANVILAALYADADSSMAARLAAEVPRSFQRPTSSTDLGRVMEQYAVAQRDLTLGRTMAAKRLVRAWGVSRVARDTSFPGQLATYYTLLLDAQLAARSRRSDALPRLSRLDSLLQAVPLDGQFEPLGNLLVARLWYNRGSPTRALASVRRHGASGLPVSYATALREEGRYAAQVGDRQAAIRAYRHYLTLRSAPEPAVRPKVERVRAELAVLERESADQ